MNVTTMEADQETAREKLKTYRSMLHKDIDGRYAAAAKAYEELAKGTPLLDMAEVFRDPPLDEKGRPKLAIARADRRQVRVFAGVDRFTFDAHQVPGRGTYSAELQRSYPTRTVERRGVYGWAMVPMVPADVRPKTGNLRDWFILWDVDQWAERSQLDPPRDPFLLKHIGGTLYAVLAEWDLTEIERAIMRQFATRS